MSSILTWNTDGYTLYSIKLKIQEVGYPDFVCLQESSEIITKGSIKNTKTLNNGVLTGILTVGSSFRPEAYYYVANWKNPGGNDRCSLAIMLKFIKTKLYSISDIMDIYSPQVKVLYPSGSFKSSRPILCIDRSDEDQISIGCVHIISRSSSPSTSAHLRNILKTNPGFRKYIIAGDFNCIPEKLDVGKTIIQPYECTRGDKIYDYFITDNANMAAFETPEVYSHDEQSDHMPVCMGYTKY